ncbi:MAG: fibronectin type III domain-containing protein [Candidatus Kapaibacterium sp.]
MNKLRFLLPAALIIASAFVMTSCEDTTLAPTTFIPNAPTGLKACSVNETTVRIAFTPSTSESNSAFKDYLLVVTSGSFDADVPLPKGATYYDISPLPAGKVYTFKLRARTNDTTSAAVSLDWAPATRYNGIRAYERSSVLGSGIDLLNGRNQTIASADLWDLCFDSSDSTFGAPGASAFADANGKIGGKQAKKTYIFALTADAPYTVTADSLNAVYETQSINDPNSPRKMKVEGLVDAKTSSGYVVYVLTADGRFAKILLKSKNGSIVQRDANGSFVEIDASVQKTALIPYAMKKGAMNIDGPGVRATKVMHVVHD